MHYFEQFGLEVYMHMVDVLATMTPETHMNMCTQNLTPHCIIKLRISLYVWLLKASTYTYKEVSAYLSNAKGAMTIHSFSHSSVKTSGG
jgi:hypothetical protein